MRQRARQLEAEGIEVHLGIALEGIPFQALAKPLGRVIVSPGIRWDHPILTQLRQQGVAVAGELAAAWEALPATPWIGITGTNGKTTVTHLVTVVLPLVPVMPIQGVAGRASQAAASSPATATPC